MTESNEPTSLLHLLKAKLPVAVISDEEATALIEAFCKIKPPKIPEADLRIDMVRIFDDGRKGGVSIKPGNITLNWKRLFGATPGMILTGVGAATNPWLAALGALVIWQEIYQKAKIDLSPVHAIAIRAMWENHDEKQSIDEDAALKVTNNALVKNDLNVLSRETFAKVVDDLSEIGCLKITHGKLWLREWIRQNW